MQDQISANGNRPLAEPDAITVRLAVAGDLPALRHLVDLDAGGAGTRHMLLDLTRPGTPSRVLIAISADDVIAALHIDSRDAVAHPFVRSEPALDLLRTRADQLRGDPSAPPGRLATLLRRHAESV
jgi:hypothetical protein